MKMKNFGWGGGRVSLVPPLDLPLHNKFIGSMSFPGGVPQWLFPGPFCRYPTPGQDRDTQDGVPPSQVRMGGWGTPDQVRMEGTQNGVPPSQGWGTLP